MSSSTTLTKLEQAKQKETQQATPGKVEKKEEAPKTGPKILLGPADWEPKNKFGKATTAQKPSVLTAIRAKRAQKTTSTESTPSSAKKMVAT